MAVTKIHGIKTTVDKAIAYICDPAKTDENIYISSFACAPETAALDFKYTLDHTMERVSNQDSFSENKAFHLIQAFEPGEVSYEQAHHIGKELADKLLEGKYSYILTTHIDKSHIHNHIIFCAADNINYNHYHDCQKSYWQIRTLSDQICQEHGLSVIIPSGKRGKKYNKWNPSLNTQNIKSQLRKDINRFVKLASSYEEFLALMQAVGYEIKNASFDNPSGKYISFRPSGKERFIRGSIKSLGNNYTKEVIKERIETQKKDVRTTSKSSDFLKWIISTNNRPDLQSNPALLRWVEKENLKIASQTYNQMISENIHNFQELNERLSSLQTISKAVKSEIISVERALCDLSEIMKYAEQYQNNESFYKRYEKALDQDRIFQKYETQIILFTGAERMLQRKGIDPKHINPEKLRSYYKELLQRKQELQNSFKQEEDKIQQLQLLNKNLNDYLNTSLLHKPSVNHSDLSHEK